MDTDALLAQLEIDEGLRLRPYTDTAGKLTIGIGHNLSDRGISANAARMICLDDIAETMAQLDANLSWWRGLDDTRQQILCNMAFNMGIMRLLGFHNFLADVERGDYESAADEMLKSLWANQVGDRAKRLASKMKGT